jgi:hypothetical protein
VDWGAAVPSARVVPEDDGCEAFSDVPEAAVVAFQGGVMEGLLLQQAIFIQTQ